ncbi:DUF6602 domain-containing protein, partial [Spirochaetota bacterium]
MFSKYFSDFDKKFTKITKTSKKAVAKGKAKKAAVKGKAKKTAKKSKVQKDIVKSKIDINLFRDNISKIIPEDYAVDSIKPVDSSGFSPDGADMILYKRKYENIVEIMNGFVPYELIYGTFFVAQELNKNSLAEMLNRIVGVKKLNMFAQDLPEEYPMNIPSFVVVNSTAYNLMDLKNDILNYYMAKSIAGEYELDILVILNKGVIIKDWREKRSFIGLETKNDT